MLLFKVKGAEHLSQFSRMHFFYKDYKNNVMSSFLSISYSKIWDCADKGLPIVPAFACYSSGLFSPNWLPFKPIIHFLINCQWRSTRSNKFVFKP